MQADGTEEKGFLSRLTGGLSTSLSAKSHIEINDSRELIAEGCMGVLLCGEDQIKLNMGRQLLLVTGTGLVISNMSGQTVCIHGRLVSLEFI